MLWREDLDALLLKLDEVEEKERQDEASVNRKGSKALVSYSDIMSNCLSRQIIKYFIKYYVRNLFLFFILFRLHKDGKDKGNVIFYSLEIILL